MSFDPIDFEQRLMECWNITSDLKTLTEGVLEHDLTKDQIANILIGLEQLYNLKFDRLSSSLKEWDQRGNCNEQEP